MKMLRLLDGPAWRVGGWLVLAALAWDLSGLDLTVMRWIGDGNGFALRHHPWLEQLAHDGVRRLLVYVLVAWLVLLALGRGPVRQWSRPERLAVALGTVAALLAVNLAKRASLTSCPWDLNEFGGPAHYVSHWMWGVVDGGSGHCFPGGHASSLLAFVGAAMPLLAGQRPHAGRAAAVLGLLLLGGAALGGVQMLRGAHYPSHTLWTVVICYAAQGAVWWSVHAGSAWRERRRERNVAYQPSPM